MNTSFDDLRVLAVLIAVCCATPSVCHADVGGGSGKAKSPYIDMHLPENTATMTRLRAEDAANKWINFTTAAGTFVHGKHIAVAFAHSGETPSTFATAFVGTTGNPASSQSIDFSEISSFTVVENQGDFIVLKLNLFPHISNEELLKRHPSYTELRDNYSKTVAIRISLMSEGKKPLVLVGNDAEEQSPPKIIARLRDIPNGQTIELGGQNLWWAISSVTNDPAYPHRVVFKK